jgi:hypothetical protein
MRTLQRTIFIGACAIAGCAGSTASIEQTWRSPTVRPGELTHVVVLVNAEDGALRRNAEDQLTLQLRARGIQAVPAYQVLTQQDLSDQQRTRRALQAKGFDGVVAMRLFGTEQSWDYAPGVYSWWGDTWDAVVPETIVRVEVNAYNLDNDQLVWSAISRSIDPTSTRELVNDVTEVVGREMGKQDVITRAPTYVTRR